ncbi:MAG: hypothetical protein PUK70_03195 [Bacteroidales bacterium]|nr:hypothetical protein [Bacteroidales bacterium]MDY6002690.1 hypothetical protein [Candidatus Cryptobacteroides sp.]
MEKVFIAKSNIFIWKNKDKVLFYDSDGQHKAKIYALNKFSSALCDRLCNPKNLYSVEFEHDSADDSLANFAEALVDDGFGRIADVEKAKHIISLPPLLNIQKAWDFIKTADVSAGSQILQYLKSLTIYVGGRSGNSQWYRQTIYPTNSDEVLVKDDIINFVNKAWSNHITEISLVFSSIGDYIEIDDLIKGLSKYGGKIKICLTSEDAYENMNAVQKIVGNSNFGLVFLHSGDNYYFPAACPKERLKRIYLIQSEGEYKKASESCEKYSDIDQDFIPVYNGHNSEFFRKNVLLTESEILDSFLSKREIFLHMAVNTNYFGKLTALPDRTVHADVNRPAIGTMDDSIYRLISNEMEANTAWRMTREFFRSCRNCLLRFLCPSPSSYENVMKLECICSDKIGGETRNT